MSRMYDHLKRDHVKPSSPGDDRQLDLFSLMRSNESPQAEPPRITESLPPRASPPEPAPPQLQRGAKRGVPLAGVIEPLSGLPPTDWTSAARRYGLLAITVAVAGAAVFFGVRSCRSAASNETPAAQTPAPSSGTTASTGVAGPERVPPKGVPAPASAAARPIQPTGESRASAQRTPMPSASPQGASDIPLRIPGARIVAADGMHTVTFDEGLFSGAVQLKPQADRNLRALAKQLAPFGRRARIIVIGCTDDTPLHSQSRFRDNKELGLARAIKVMNVMREAGPLSEAEFRTISMGGEWSPHPNDTPANRAKNRTVVLQISLSK